ncbi:hypothetical protein PENSPDRAFT_750058 [Peniophora sp. CONT]|nr:hypothetical protein PENSPDRAFT_750058 [Peniophora sp. CONT]
MADQSAPECIDISAMIPSGSGPALVPVAALKALLDQTLKSQVLEEPLVALMRRNLRSFLKAGLSKPTQEWPFYALLSYLLHHFLDTITFANGKASILCFPQARFTNKDDDIAPAPAATSDVHKSPSGVEPSSSSTLTPLDTPVPESTQSKQAPRAGTMVNEGERRVDHRDPDFAQYAFFELDDGTVVKVLSSWLEAKAEPRPNIDSATTDDKGYRKALVRDIVQLTEQAELAFLQQPQRETFVSLYTCGKRFTAFKWPKTKTSISDVGPSDSAPAQTTEASCSSQLMNAQLMGAIQRADTARAPLGDSLREGQDTDEDLSDSEGDSDTGCEDAPRGSPASVPVQSDQTIPSTRDPVPITDPRSFPGTFCWEDDLRTKLLRCAEAAKQKFFETMNMAHGRSLPVESRKSLRKRYDKIVTAEALVDMHPQPLYYNVNILTGSDEHLCASHQFTNSLRLAHSGTDYGIQYEQSDFFPVSSDENDYRPSESDFLDIEEAMKDLYYATIDREWKQCFEDKRRSHETEGGNRSGNSSYAEGGSLEEDDSGDFGEAPLLSDDMPAALRDKHPASPDPASQAAVESPSSLSTSKRVHFANDDAPSTSTPRMTRSQRRASQVARHPGVAR